MSEKKKRIFIYCEGVGAFIPLEDMDQVKTELDCMWDGDRRNLEFMCKNMTDEEFENLPEAE